MITLNELCAYNDKLLGSAAVPDYCPNGLQIEGAPRITRFATAVSASLDTINAAIEFQAQALIVHHGLFWTGDNYTIIGSKRDKIKRLLQNDISLLAYHLPLDIHTELGNNWKAAMDMGWTDLQPFGLYKGVTIGVKGRLPSITREQFKQKLEEFYQHPANCALGGKSHVETAALISGGAYKSISDAAADNIDCFVTGNFDEPVWHQAFEEKINFYALGHSATERIGPQALGKHLQQQFGLEYQFLDIHNPF